MHFTIRRLEDVFADIRFRQPNAIDWKALPRKKRTEAKLDGSKECLAAIEWFVVDRRYYGILLTDSTLTEAIGELYGVHVEWVYPHNVFTAFKKLLKEKGYTGPQHYDLPAVWLNKSQGSEDDIAETTGVKLGNVKAILAALAEVQSRGKGVKELRIPRKSARYVGFGLQKSAHDWRSLGYVADPSLLHSVNMNDRITASSNAKTCQECFEELCRLRGYKGNCIWDLRAIWPHKDRGNVNDIVSASKVSKQNVEAILTLLNEINPDVETVTKATKPKAGAESMAKAAAGETVAGEDGKIKAWKVKPDPKIIPTKQCAKCDWYYHPRSAACAHCGTANPAKGKPKGAAAGASPKRGRPAKAAAPSGSASHGRVTEGQSTHGMVAAMDFIKASGGLAAAKARLDEIEGFIRG